MFEEVKEAIHKMRGGRVTEPDEIPSEFWKSAGKVALEWLNGFNIILRTTRMPEE